MEFKTDKLETRQIELLTTNCDSRRDRMTSTPPTLIFELKGDFYISEQCVNTVAKSKTQFIVFDFIYTILNRVRVDEINNWN